MSKKNENTYESINEYTQDNKSIASPAAQTFLATKDAYLSEIDLYFTSLEKDSNNIGDPVTIQIRNCLDNGEPGNRVYSETTDTYSQLQTGGSATPFIFKDPVLIKAGHNYSFLLYTAAQNYQLAVSTNGRPLSSNVDDTYSTNSNGKVHGSFYYSMDGISWSKGDPTGQLDASTGGLCLKFDLKVDKFNPQKTYDFEVNPINYSYNRVNPQTPKYNNLHQDGISYMTFSPKEYTPYGTSIDWTYTLGDSPIPHNLPLHTTIPINLKHNDITVHATLKGNENFSPVINKGSMHLATERTICDSDNRESQNNGGNPVDSGLGNFEFPTHQILNDNQNSGEYISKVIEFGDTPDSQNSLFNQINASFEELNGNEPVSLYVNLNPNHEPYSRNGWRNHWFQMNGYDEYHQNGKDLLSALRDNGGSFNNNVSQDMQPSTDYLIVNPRNGIAYEPDASGNASTNTGNLDTYTQHSYHETTENTYDGSWTRYHFHLSLKRLWNIGNGMYRQKGATKDVAHELQFKIVFHAATPYDHPKVRKFLSTVGKNDEREQQSFVN